MINHHLLRTNSLPVLLGILLPARMTAPIEVTSPPGTADPLVFSIKAATLRFDTRDEIEPYLIPLVENPDVEEVHLSGNTYGIEACKFLGEILYAKKKLKVLTGEIFHAGSLTRFVGSTLCRYLLNTLANRNPSSSFLPTRLNPKSSQLTHHKPLGQCLWINSPSTPHKVLFLPLAPRTCYPRQQRSWPRSRLQHRKCTCLPRHCKV